MKSRAIILVLSSLSGLVIFWIFFMDAMSGSVTPRQVAQTPGTDPDSITVLESSDSYFTPTSSVDSLLLQAMLLVDEAGFDSASILADRALKLYEDEENTRGIVRSINVKADALERAGRYQEALSLLEHNAPKIQYWLDKKLITDTASFLNKFGVVYHKLKSYDKALEYYQSALKIRRSNIHSSQIDIARSLNNIGVVYAEFGQFDRALDYYLKALSIRRNTLGELHRDVAQNYNNIGVLYKNMGDYEQALSYHQHALSVRQDILGSNHPEVGDSYYNIGVVFGMMNDPESALLFHEKSLNIWQKSLGDHHRLIHFNLSALGADYLLKDDIEQALIYQKRLLNLLSENSQLNKELISNSFYDLGELYAKTNDYIKAHDFHKKALAGKIEVWRDRHPSIAVSYNALGRLALQRETHDEALFMVEQALHANQNIASPTVSASPDINSYLSTSELLNSLLLKADIYFERSHTKMAIEKVQDLDNSLNVFYQVMEVIQQYRRSFQSEGSKLFLADQASSTFAKAIKVATRLYELTGEERYLEAIFSFMEKSKASVLIDALHEADARRFAQLPDSLITYEKQLRVELAFYDRKLKGEEARGAQSDSVQVYKWQTKLFELNQVYNSLMSKLESDFPEYYDLKFKSYTASLDDVQKYVLNDDDALIEYFLGPDSLYILVATKDLVKIAYASHDSVLEEQIKDYRDSILERDRESFGSIGYAIYNKLLSPVVDVIQNKPSWIVIPHGILNYLPFESLITEPISKEVYYINLPFVIRNYSIRYGYSSTIEVSDQLKRASSESVQDNTWNRDFIGFAPVFSDGISREMFSAEILAGQSRGKEPLHFQLGSDEFVWRASNAGTDGPDPYYKRIDSLLTASSLPWGYLPNTRKEINEIHALFRKKYSWKERFFGDRTSKFLEANATESMLKTVNLGDYRFIHLATHAVINEAEPALSGIIMSQDTTNGEDGVLHLGEIYNLELDAELVALSACDTGLGKLAQGEGIIGLTRGFMYAGAQSLLVSLWKVEDSSTRQLMLHFYRHLLDGLPKAEAARKAKLEVMDLNPIYSIPYYWAGFILIGE